MPTTPILASEIRPADPATKPFRIILTESLNSTHENPEWVTHLETTDDNGRNWGHYHRDFVEAVREYEERCKRYGLDPQRHEDSVLVS